MNLSLLAALLSAVPAPSPQDGDFEKLHALIKPEADELKFLRVPWLTSVTEARRKAAAEGKPLFIWTMAGEPLGQC